jgi:tetratricopeptide (TPR) repeat protein
MKGKWVIIVSAAVVLFMIIMIGPVLSSLNPSALDARVSILAGDALLYFDQPDAALGWYARAYHSVPDEVTVEKIGNAALKAKKYDLGEAFFNSYASQNPGDLRVLVAEGDLLMDKGAYSQARDFFRKASVAYPDNPNVWLRYGDAALFLSISKQQEMKDLSGRTRTGGQENLTAVAQASVDASDYYREAVGAYQEAIRIDPRNSLYVSTRIVPHAQGMASDFEEVLKNTGG